jgi:hypothetical protein
MPLQLTIPDMPHDCAPLGLSSSHICPRPSTMFHTFAYRNGRHVRLKGTRVEGSHRETMEYGPDPVPGAEPHPLSGNYWQPKRRGAIRGFSRASRLRMLEKTAGMDWKALEHPALLLTLTYPSEWPEDWMAAKAHLLAFRKRLFRRWPGAGVFWKMERQQRGAPHFHLLVYNVAFIPIRWLAANWYQIVGSKDPLHLKAGTQVARVRSSRQAVAYAAKYLGKLGENGDNEAWGRRWGIWNAKQLPIKLVIAPLSTAAAHKLRRWLWAYQRSNGYRRRGKRGRYDGTTAWLSWEAFNRLLDAALE